MANATRIYCRSALSPSHCFYFEIPFIFICADILIGQTLIGQFYFEIPFIFILLDRQTDKRLDKPVHFTLEFPLFFLIMRTDKKKGKWGGENKPLGNLKVLPRGKYITKLKK